MSGTPNTAYDGPELFCKNCGSKCAGLFEDMVASRSREAVRS